MKRQIVFAATALAVVAACTLTQSLDYLQAGSPDAGTNSGDGGDATDTPNYPPPAVISPTQKLPQFLAADVDNLYWIDSDRSIQTVPKRGGTTQRIFTFPAAPALPPVQLAADPGAGPDTYLYTIVGNVVQRVRKSGGGPAETIVSGPPAASFLVADNGVVFAVLWDGQTEKASSIVRAQSDGGARTTIATAQDARALAISGQKVFWFNDDFDNGVSIRALVKTSSADGGVVENFAPQDTTSLTGEKINSLHADSEAAYAAAERYAVDRIRLATTPVPATTLVDGVVEPDTLISHAAVDEAYAFVTDARAQGRILRTPKTGGPVVPIATGLLTPTSILVDNQGIYFLTLGVGMNDGAVQRLPKL